jgi:alpha-L-fucosidase
MATESFSLIEFRGEKNTMTIFKRIVFVLVACLPAVINSQTTYTATWASVEKHKIAPEWFQDAKFGLWFHWGVYSVPAYGYEWYPRNMYNTTSGEYTHHKATYGDPKGNWPYQNFILGANDLKGNWVQFAPKLVSAGGKLDPDEWAALFDSAGAKIAGPVAEHHDGFSMWGSKVNPWNALSKGPKLDLVKVLTDAFRARGLKVMCSLHHAWNTTGYYEYAPAQTVDSLKRLYGQISAAEAERVWLEKLKEVIDGYKPDYIWQDHNVVKMSESARLTFLSYYFNKEADWGKEVVASYNDGLTNACAVKQYERGGPAAVTSPYWLTEDAVSSSTWSYTSGMSYYSSAQLLHRLIDIVSKNGNLILNISPMADGTIPQQQRTILLAMGDWLRRFGESIYSTRAWTVYGEGPTLMGGGSFTAPVAGTNKDFRFTRSKDSTTMYAVCLGWPGNGTKVTIASVTAARFKATGIYLFSNTAGTYIKLDNFTQGTGGISFNMPATQPYTALAYAFRITSEGSVGVNQQAVINNQSVSPVHAGELFRGTIPISTIKARGGIAGIEVFSLQGKKIMKVMFNNAENVNDFKKLNDGSSQGYYVKYIPNSPENRP